MRKPADSAIVDRLKQLTSLSDSEVADVARAGRVVHVPESWSLIWEKTPADAAYYILEGTVSIRRDKTEVATLGAGDFIGEAAILNHRLRSASVVTTTEVTAQNFSAEAGLALAAKIPRIDEALRATNAQRVEANSAR